MLICLAQSYVVPIFTQESGKFMLVQGSKGRIYEAKRDEGNEF